MASGPTHNRDDRSNLATKLSNGFIGGYELESDLLIMAICISLFNLTGQDIDRVSCPEERHIFPRVRKIITKYSIMEKL